MIKFKIYAFLSRTKLYPYNNIIVFFLYVLLSLLMTYPLILQLKTSIYGIGHDNLGWLSNNFLQLKIWSENINPENINYLAFPKGLDLSSNLYMYTHEILNTSLLAITQHPIISYNIYFIIKLILAGYCMYQLSYYLSKDRTLSFIIGSCFAYSPYFLNMSKAYGASFITFSLPIVVLYIFKTTKQTNLKNLIFLIISFLILLGENYYYGYFFTVSLFTTIPILAIIVLIIDKDIVIEKFMLLNKLTKIHTIFLTAISLSLLLFFSILLKHVYPYFSQRAFDIWQARIHSTMWEYYLLPSVTNSSINSYLFSIHQTIMDNIVPNHAYIQHYVHEMFERTNFLGYSPIVIIIITVFIILITKNIHLFNLNKYKLFSLH